VLPVLPRATCDDPLLCYYYPRVPRLQYSILSYQIPHLIGALARLPRVVAYHGHRVKVVMVTNSSYISRRQQEPHTQKDLSTEYLPPQLQMPPSNESLLVMLASHATRLSAVIRTSLSTPDFLWLRAFFAQWLKLDLTTLAAALTIYGTLSGALKDLQGIALKIYWWFTRFFTASISITSNDRLNREIINWLGAQILTRSGTRILTARTESIRSDAWSPR
jgi:hypothetical protein